MELAIIRVVAEERDYGSEKKNIIMKLISDGFHTIPAIYLFNKLDYEKEEEKTVDLCDILSPFLSHVGDQYE